MTYDLNPASKIYRTEAKGRHMMAEKIIEMYQVIMKEKSFANWIQRGYQKDNCNYCVHRKTLFSFFITNQFRMTVNGFSIESREHRIYGVAIAFLDFNVPIQCIVLMNKCMIHKLI